MIHAVKKTTYIAFGYVKAFPSLLLANPKDLPNRIVMSWWGTPSATISKSKARVIKHRVQTLPQVPGQKTADDPVFKWKDCNWAMHQRIRFLLFGVYTRLLKQKRIA